MSQPRAPEQRHILIGALVTLSGYRYDDSTNSSLSISHERRIKPLPVKVSPVGAARPDAIRTAKKVMIVNCMLASTNEWYNVQLLKSGDENVKLSKVTDSGG